MVKTIKSINIKYSIKIARVEHGIAIMKLFHTSDFHEPFLPSNTSHLIGLHAQILNTLPKYVTNV